MNEAQGFLRRTESDKMANPFRISAIEGLEEGDTFSYERVFSRDDTVSFGDLTRDYNPVHYDTRWTRLKGFKDLVCHESLQHPIYTIVTVLSRKRY